MTSEQVTPWIYEQYIDHSLPLLKHKKQTKTYFELPKQQEVLRFTNNNAINLQGSHSKIQNPWVKSQQTELQFGNDRINHIKNIDKLRFKASSLPHIKKEHLQIWQKKSSPKNETKEQMTQMRSKINSMIKNHDLAIRIKKSTDFSGKNNSKNTQLKIFQKNKININFIYRICPEEKKKGVFFREAQHKQKHILDRLLQKSNLHK